MLAEIELNFFLRDEGKVGSLSSQGKLLASGLSAVERAAFLSVRSLPPSTDTPSAGPYGRPIEEDNHRDTTPNERASACRAGPGYAEFMAYILASATAENSCLRGRVLTQHALLVRVEGGEQNELTTPPGLQHADNWITPLELVGA